MEESSVVVTGEVPIQLLVEAAQVVVYVPIVPQGTFVVEQEPVEI